MADEVKTSSPANSCAFFVKRKNRYCKMLVGRGRKYCGEHMYLGGEDEAQGRRRVPCPLDPKHTVYDDRLKKHLKHCNVKKKTNVVYYEKSINSGISDYQLSPEEKIPLPSVSQEKLAAVIEKVNKCYKEHCPYIEEGLLCHQVFKDELSKGEYGPSAIKHLKQQSSLVAHLDKLGLLQPDVVYLEFGAGRGKLSHWIQKAHPQNSNVDYVLIDRASNRYKYDSYHKRNDQGPSFQRVNLDIEHLNLGNVKCVCNGSRNIVAASKHLCGTATDLTLRCLLETLEDTSHTRTQGDAETSSVEREPKRSRMHQASPRVQGIVVALCCHHRCFWPHYIGRPFLEGLGFTPAEFHLVCSISSWATCGIRPSKEERDEHAHLEDSVNNTDIKGAVVEDSNNTTKSLLQDQLNGDDVVRDPPGYKALGLSIADREEIGRHCKRLLDVGRLWYLKSKGFHAKLAYYVDASVSLENVVLLATTEIQK